MPHQTIQQLYMAALEGPADGYPARVWPLLRQQIPFTRAEWHRQGPMGERVVLSGELVDDAPATVRRSVVIERTGFRHQFGFVREAAGSAFTEGELARLTDLCSHAVCALHLNHQMLLARGAQAPADPEPTGMATVSAEGSVVSADSCFLSLIVARKADWDQRYLPFVLAADPRLPVQGMVWQGLFIRFERVGVDFRVLIRKDRRAPELSPREFEIAERIARGMTFKEVAREMDLAPSTVSTHLYRLYDKIGIRRRADLQIWLKRSQQGY